MNTGIVKAQGVKDVAYVLTWTDTNKAGEMETQYLFPTDNVEPTDSTTELIKAYFFDTREMADTQASIWYKDLNTRTEEIDMTQFKGLHRVSGFTLFEKEGTVIEKDQITI